MSIKSLAIYHTDCRSAHPCKHYGMIEKIDGSVYKGLICSSVTNAIISHISLKCLQLLDKTQYVYESGSDATRKLKFLSHIYLYQQHKDKPLSEVLKELTFVKCETTSPLTSPLLNEFKTVVAEAQICNDTLSSSNAAFAEAPLIQDKLKAVKEKIFRFFQLNSIDEEEIRLAASCWSQADLLAYTICNKYNDQSYQLHIDKLTSSSNEIKAILPNLQNYPVDIFRIILDKFNLEILRRKNGMLPFMPGTASASLSQKLTETEQNAYVVWQQSSEMLNKLMQQSSSASTAEIKDKNPKSSRASTAEIIENTAKSSTASTAEIKENTTQEKKESSLEIPEEFICPLTFEIMKDPVITPNGTTCEKQAILVWLTTKKTCPFSIESLTPAQLVPNRILKGLIEKWQSENAAEEVTVSEKKEPTQTIIQKIPFAADRSSSVILDLNEIIQKIEYNVFTSASASLLERNNLVAAIEVLKKSMEGEFDTALWSEAAEALKKANRLFQFIQKL